MKQVALKEKSLLNDDDDDDSNSQNSSDNDSDGEKKSKTHKKRKWWERSATSDNSDADMTPQKKLHCKSDSDTESNSENEEPGNRNKIGEGSKKIMQSSSSVDRNEKNYKRMSDRSEERTVESDTRSLKDSINNCDEDSYCSNGNESTLRMTEEVERIKAIATGNKAGSPSGVNHKIIVTSDPRSIIREENDNMNVDVEAVVDANQTEHSNLTINSNEIYEVLDDCIMEVPSTGDNSIGIRITGVTTCDKLFPSEPENSETIASQPQTHFLQIDLLSDDD